VQLGADLRVEPVGADKRVAAQLPQRPARPVAHPDGDPGGGFGERDERGSRAHRAGPEPVPHRGEQDHLQLAPVNRVLRPAVADVPAARETPDPVAVPVEVHHLRGGDAGRLELGAEAEFGQLAHRVRHQVDPHAERSQRGCRVDHDRLDPGGVQRERRREPADTRPRDDDAHHSNP
jgi:hypothetical protein